MDKVKKFWWVGHVVRMVEITNIYNLCVRTLQDTI